jgi:hypothetical protein
MLEILSFGWLKDLNHSEPVGARRRKIGSFGKPQDVQPIRLGRNGLILHPFSGRRGPALEAISAST